ncbi:MAG: 40S ribosomal protein S6 [Marteilia pararefringens]
MKFSISHPKLGTSIQFEIVEEKDYSHFFGKKLGDIISGEMINREWKGYLFKITGGSLNTGTPMKQGVLTEGRRKLLLKPGTTGFRSHERHGIRIRKSIGGCIISNLVVVLNLIVVRKGEIEIPNLTDKALSIMKGPKRASKIIKLFQLGVTDKVHNHVIPRRIEREGKKTIVKKPRVMRLINARKRAHKRHALDKLYSQIKARREAKENYEKLLREIHAKKEAKTSTSASGTSGSKILKSRMSSGIIKLV